MLSETLDQTYPHLSAALGGVKRLSDTIGKRDDQIKELLANASKVARVFGERSEQIDNLFVNANTLLAAFTERSKEMDVLLSNVSAVSTHVSSLIRDNPNLDRVLRQLGAVGDELVKRKKELADVLVLLSRYTASLTEAVASGPYFKAIAVNLLPYQILQPWVDAAFKKRGIDPEEFWRNAGLPAFRFPDPNGTRFPNGAPPPAPTVLEGIPDHPGRPFRRDRRAPTPRRPTACRGLEIHCLAQLWMSGRSVVVVSRRRSTSRPPRQSQRVCRGQPVSRSPASRVSRRLMSRHTSAAIA
ncbi:mCE-family protein Mce1C [Mycobacterium xenopi 4042]|uniref:MCE-family protein Mce1C n=1 Tax=Mycobacterium xenopi 4042 TaxID=1299334 RepID=X8DLI8_MYCXE|nr:mCE-family protein Mce1C [Mycobacterium xenopi 4042]